MFLWKWFLAEICCSKGNLLHCIRFICQARSFANIVLEEAVWHWERHGAHCISSTLRFLYFRKLWFQCLGDEELLNVCLSSKYHILFKSLPWCVWAGKNAARTAGKRASTLPLSAIWGTSSCGTFTPPILATCMSINPVGNRISTLEPEFSWVPVPHFYTPNASLQTKYYQKLLLTDLWFLDLPYKRWSLCEPVV
jgi:hypothetical protein